MKLTRSPFIFLRHGETEANAQSIIAGRTDSPLSNHGRSQARLAAEQLRQTSWSRVVCSALSRTGDTARLAAPGCDPVIDSRLNERDWGDLEGQPLDQLVPYKSTPPGGEPWESFERRVTEALNKWLEEEGQALVVGHSGVYRVVCQHIFGRPEGPRIANAAPVLIQPQGSGWTITDLGKTS
ncbi:MAG: histidine phosphatase family protein [Pseudohongiellaceae bacterium]